jgi:hypothetical protein
MLIQFDAFTHEFVENRRLDFGAMPADVRPAEVIRDYEKNVWLGWEFGSSEGRQGCAKKGKSANKAESRDVFH